MRGLRSGDPMDEPDFSKTDLEELRQLALSRSALSEYAMREMTRRAYNLPAEVPPPRLAEPAVEV